MRVSSIKMQFRYLFIIPCCLLIIAIITAGSWGLADIENQKVRSSIKQWENDFESFNAEDWNMVISHAKAALDKDPHNPDLLTLMGNVYEWNSFQTDREPQNYQNRKLALDYYRQAVLLRPQWPYTWSGIALLKYRMLEIDEEFKQALTNATDLGPWEPHIQKIITEIGLSAWGELENRQRLIVVENIMRGLTMQPRVILDILRKYNQLRMVCHEKNRDAVVEDYCKKNFSA